MTGCAGGAPLQPKYALARVKYLCVTVGKAAAPFYNHGTMSETNLKQNQAAVESAAAERDGAESGVFESAASEPVVAETRVAHKSGVSAAMQKEAFQAAWPIVLGYIVLGIPCGILGVAAGMDVWMIAIMSLLFYSGAGQYMIPNMWLAGNPISAIIASVALVNTRQMLYGASLSQFCGSAGKRLAFIFGATVTDESFGVNLARMINGNWSVKHALLVNLFSLTSWTVSNVAGALIGSAISLPTALASFAMTSLFICLLCMQKVTPANLVAVFGSIAGVIACKCVGLAGPAILIGALVGVGAAFAFSSVRHDDRNTTMKVGE